MKKYRIIGCMTGNSMDAIDLVLTEFTGQKMLDICTYSWPYPKKVQQEMEYLRKMSFNKTRFQIEKIPKFRFIHDKYIFQIAECIHEMCKKNNIDRTQIDAVGFHGKTLDHNPPSKAKGKSKPYTVQLGSGQMLSDLIQIPVIYDFRSDFIMEGLEGAPLIGPHNAHISFQEGDGIYYNGGNTCNFSLIKGGKVLFSSDAGPFNEYVDNFIRQNTSFSFDKDGKIGEKGTLDISILKKLFDFVREFYETPLPKSGDPAYYKKDLILKHLQKQGKSLFDIVCTLEYFSAYIAAYSLALIPSKFCIPDKIILFGGGWKNPVVVKNFKKLLTGKGVILSEHQELFKNFFQRIQKKFVISYSVYGEYMEARLMADLAYHKLMNKAWLIPETKKKIICGRCTFPERQKRSYFDCLSRASK